MRNFLVVVSIFVLVGCSFGGFQPPPYTFENWQKIGADFIGVQKALLECGLPNPAGTGDFSTELYARVLACMENDGFVEKYDPDSFCRNDHDKLYYCQPENKKSAPKRDVNLRLNGKYCTYKSSYKGANGEYIPIDHATQFPDCQP